MASANKKKNDWDAKNHSLVNTKSIIDNMTISWK
jgi:hypothetical protein